MTQQTYTPDWSKAPTDANWHARDSDGCGFWYNKRPAPSRGFWSVGRSLTIADNDCPVLDHDSELDNWRDTLTVRPFQDRDIPQNLSDYFTGKTPFITAYVDLLLARMAKEGRFSTSIAFEKSQSIQVNDIVIFEENSEWVFAIVDIVNNDYLGLFFSTQKTNGKWTTQNWFDVGLEDFVIRRITQAEAVEFRKAMEAVYG
ncbi:hypothetical protein MOXK02_18110 [Moraxella sp. K02]